MTTTDPEHIESSDCWCKPHVEYVYPRDHHDMRGMVFNATVKSLDGFKRYPLLDMARWVADALCDDLSEIDGFFLPDGSEFRRVRPSQAHGCGFSHPPGRPCAIRPTGVGS